MSEPFVFPSNYGIPLLSAAVLSFECIMTGFVIAGRARSKVFTKEFMKQNFDEIHYENTEKEDVSTQEGYPDMGNGRFSEKLPYADWLYFNRAQRVHYNFIEMIAPMLTLILIAGIEFPQASGGLGFALVLARIFFCGYISKNGPKNIFRSLGAITGDFAIIALLVLSIITCSRHMQ